MTDAAIHRENNEGYRVYTYRSREQNPYYSVISFGNITQNNKALIKQHWYTSAQQTNDPHFVEGPNYSRPNQKQKGKCALFLICV